MNQHRYTCPRCSWPVKAPVVGQTEPIVCLNCRAQIEPMTGAILNGDAPTASAAPVTTAPSLPPPKKAYPRKPVSAAGMASSPQSTGQAGSTNPAAAQRAPAGPQHAQGAPYPAQVPPQYPPQGSPYPAQQPPLRYPPQQGAPYPAQQPPHFLAPGQARPGQPGAFYGPAPVVRRGMPRWGWALIAACAVVMIGLVALGIWAAGGGATNTDNWITYTAPDGSFTAKFPGEPAVQSHRLDNGVVVRETMYRSAWGHWEVSWIDMTGREIWFQAAVNELARTSGSKITFQEERKWKGKTGYYAELDEGVYTIQMFIAQSRLWTVAVYKHDATFQFFLDNLKISDEAMGIDPLGITFAQEGVAFEGIDSTRWTISIRGGRMPYKVDLSKPTADTRYVKDHTGEAWEDHIGSSSSAKAGSYPVQASVTDADGRTATGKWVVEVQKMLGEIGRLDVALRYGLTGLGPTGTNSLEVSHGCVVHGEAVFVPTHPQYSIVQPYYNADGLPDWLALAPRGTGTFSGRAETVGVYTFKVHTKIRLEGLDKWFPMERTVTVEVVPLSKDDLPEQFGSFEIKHVTGFVSASLAGEVHFLAPVPDEWVGTRDWKVDAQWALTASEMTKLVPKGISVSILQPEGRDAYAWLHFSGQSRTAIDSVVDFKLIVTIKYLPEPIELTASVQFKTEEPVAPEQLSNPMEYVIRCGAGANTSRLVASVVNAPPDWPQGMGFSYQLEWLIDDVSMPEGLRLEVAPSASYRGQDLRVKGNAATPGDYYVEVPVRVTVAFRGTDKTYDLVQKIKIVIS